MTILHPITAIDQYRLSVEDFAINMDTTRAFVDSIDEAAQDINAPLSIPGDIADKIELFQDAIDVPQPIVTALSAAPYGIGTAVRQFDRVSDQASDAVEPTRQRLDALDDRLEPVTDRLTALSEAAAGVEPVLDQGDALAATRLDTIEMIETALLPDAQVIGAGLAGRAEAGSAQFDPVNVLIDAIEPAIETITQAATGISETLEALPEEAVDTALDVVDTAFRPIGDAFDTIENTLCNTFTVVPGVPSTTVPNPLDPFGVLPFVPDTITTPAVSPVTVNICDVLGRIDSLIGVVQNFVEDKILDLLDTIGIDLRGAVDSLKDKLLAPFAALEQALADAEARVSDIVERVTAAVDAVQDFFADLTQMLREIPDRLFANDQIGTDGADALTAEGGFGAEGDALFGRAGNDALTGGTGDNFLFGGPGEDMIAGGAGTDELYGGADADTFLFTGDFGRDLVSDGSGGEVIAFEAGVALEFAQDGDNLIIAVIGSDDTVTVEGWYATGRYDGATITVGGEEIDAETGDVVDPEGGGETENGNGTGNGNGNGEVSPPVVPPAPDPWTEAARAVLDGVRETIDAVVPGCLPPNPLMGVIFPDLPQPAVCVDFRGDLQTVVDKLESVLDRIEVILGGSPVIVPLREAVDQLAGADPGGRLLDVTNSLIAQIGDLPGPDRAAFEAPLGELLKAVNAIAEGADPVATVESLADEILPGIRSGLDAVAGSLPDGLAGGIDALTAELGALDGSAPVDLPGLIDSVTGPLAPVLPGDIVDTLTGIAEDLGGLGENPALEIAQNVTLFFTELLGRAPADAGLNHWIDAAQTGFDLNKLAGSFIDSLEFESKFGDTDSLGNRSFVETLFEDVLGREGANGIDFWSGELDEGVRSRDEVVVAFVISEENRDTTPELDALVETGTGDWALMA